MVYRRIGLYILLCFFVSQIANSKGATAKGQTTVNKTYSGTIKQCEIIELGTWGFKYFIGMEFKREDSPYIRFNIPHTELEQYKTWCNNHSQVTVRYRIKQTAELDNVTYWAEDIEAKQ
jgi:hypothetical protein